MCCQDFPIKDRIRLIDAVITPTVLYGSSSWTMTKDRARRLIVAQRQMLRRLCCVRRRTDEDWVEWIKRATAAVDEKMVAHGLDYWTKGQRRKIWRWARKVAQMDETRWAQLLALWKPAVGARSVGRPRKRWSDVFDDFFSSLDCGTTLEWLVCAQDDKAWDAHEQVFC